MFYNVLKGILYYVKCSKSCNVVEQLTMISTKSIIKTISP